VLKRYKNETCLSTTCGCIQLLPTVLLFLNCLFSFFMQHNTKPDINILIVPCVPEWDQIVTSCDQGWYIRYNATQLELVNN
jgi:hypothetical protein